jgi:hypothetical protein
MANKQITFESIDIPTNNVSTLGSLVFDLKQSLGSKALIDLSGISFHQPLARDLIAALYHHASPSRISSGHSIQTYKDAMVDLLSYCAMLKLPDNFRMMNIDFEFLLNFRAHLKMKYLGIKSATYRRRFGNISRLIEAGQDIGLANIDFYLPRNFSHIKDSDRTQPYSAGEALDIEAACRDHIRELLQRLDEGRSMLSGGKNPQTKTASRDPLNGRILAVEPKDRPWNHLPNLLWYVVNRLNGRYFKRHELIGRGHSSFINAITGAFKGRYRAPDIYGRLYPFAVDLIPFIILLAKKTGRNESSILSLKRDCLVEVNGRHFMWYEKLRGDKRMYKKSISNDGPFSPVALIKTLQNITEPLSSICNDDRPEYQNYLFLGFTIRGHNREAIKPLDSSYIKYQMNSEDGWCSQRKLLDENDNKLNISIRSMRVYYLTEKYKKCGQLSKVSRDAAHTLQNATISYLENDSMRDSHEQAIVSGIQSAKNISKPIVITENLSFQSMADTISLDESIVLGILKGEQDVFFASCKDYFNRPGATPNTPCDKPWGCFTCSNAIITRHVLPRVIAFRDFILSQKNELTMDDWQIKFGWVWDVIAQDVLPKFNRDVITEAEELARNQILYIPLALKVG